MMRNVFFLLLAVSNVSAFQFLSKFKIKTPVNVESEKLMKDRFGDKSEYFLSNEKYHTL